MLRSSIGLTLGRPAPPPRFSGSSGRKIRHGSCTADNIKRAIESFYKNWKGAELLFVGIALITMVTYKYNVTGNGILGYRFDEARKEWEKARKNNVDISLC